MYNISTIVSQIADGLQPQPSVRTIGANVEINTLIVFSLSRGLYYSFLEPEFGISSGRVVYDFITWYFISLEFGVFESITEAMYQDCSRRIYFYFFVKNA